MNRHILICFATIIIATAGWAYHVNYKTITAIENVNDLRHQIAKERETLQVLRVEWAYLNAPERLARLVEMHRAELALVGLTPDALGEVAAIPFPKGVEPEEDDEPLALAPAMPLPQTRPVAMRLE